MGPNELADAALLDDVGAPAGDAAGGKDGGEGLAGQAYGLEQHGGEELDVRGQRALRVTRPQATLGLDLNAPSQGQTRRWRRRRR